MTFVFYHQDIKTSGRAVYRMPVLQTVNLKKYYQQGETVTKALDGVSLEINGGEFVSIVGTSGSGKSTLLHMMGGLDSPTSGSVIINGEDISQKSAEQLTVFRRRHIGFVFQNYNLVPVLNVYENIVLPVQLDGKKVDKKLMDEIVEVLGLQESEKSAAEYKRDRLYGYLLIGVGIATTCFLLFGWALPYNGIL